MLLLHNQWSQRGVRGDVNNAITFWRTSSIQIFSQYAEWRRIRSVNRWFAIY